MEKNFFVQEIEAGSGTLYRVAYSILQNDDACRDAMQDAALKAWEKRASLKETRYFRTWMTRILINACYDERRRRKRGAAAGDMGGAADADGTPPDPMLSAALQSLPEKLRLPLVLCYAEGMAYAEIARTLRLPEATVRGRIARAKEKLRKELSEA